MGLSEPRRSSHTHTLQPVMAEMGLYNMGNTCYLNAVLQALAGCDVLREYFCAMDPQQRPSSHRGVLLESLRQLIVRLAGEPDAVAPGATAVAPRALLAAFHRVNPMFEDFGQHVRTEMGALCPTLHCFPQRMISKRLHDTRTVYTVLQEYTHARRAGRPGAESVVHHYPRPHYHSPLSHLHPTHTTTRTPTRLCASSSMPSTRNPNF